MFRPNLTLLLSLATLAFGLTFASSENPTTPTEQPAAGSPTRSPKPPEHVVAIVNGEAIGDEDVHLALNASGHNKQMSAEQMKNVLEVIIRRELLRQRAVELGLDANLSYQKKLRQMEAQIDAFKREELADLLWRDVTAKTQVSEAEGRKYFEDNATRIRTEYQVWQILRRKENLIEQASSELEQGTSFEEIARRPFAKFSKSAGAPWDSGYLKWNQVPDSWRSAIEKMKKGDVSGVIRGPNNRFWIIKLLDKRENADITFESIKPTVMEILKNERIETRRETIDRELRAKASVVYVRDPVPAPEEE